MSLIVVCKCGKRYKVPDDMGGRRARCKECGEIISIPRPPTDPSVEAPSDLPSKPPGQSNLKKVSAGVYHYDGPYEACWVAMLSAFTDAGVRFLKQDLAQGRIRGHKLRPRGLCAQALFRQAGTGGVDVELTTWFLRSEGPIGMLISLITGDIVTDQAGTAAAEQEVIEVIFSERIHPPAPGSGSSHSSVMAPLKKDLPETPKGTGAGYLLLGLLSLALPLIAPFGVWLSLRRSAGIRASGGNRGNGIAFAGLLLSLVGCLWLITLIVVGTWNALTK